MFTDRMVSVGWLYAAIALAMFLFGILCIPVWHELRAQLRYRLVRRRQRQLQREWDRRRAARMREAIR